MKKRTNKSILDYIQTRRELLAKIIKRRMTTFERARRNNRCDLVKTCILGMMPGKKNRATQYSVGPTLITSRSGQGHPWKKKNWQMMGPHGVKIGCATGSATTE